MKKRTCKICDKLFIPKNNRQKYCCPTCSKKAKLKKQQEDTRAHSSIRANKEIYQWYKALGLVTKKEVGFESER